MESKKLYHAINEQTPGMLYDLLLARDILKHIDHPFHEQLTQTHTVLGAYAHTVPLPENCRHRTTTEVLAITTAVLYAAAACISDFGNKKISDILPKTEDEEQITQRDRTTGNLARKLGNHALRFGIMAARFHPAGYGPYAQQLLPR